MAEYIVNISENLGDFDFIAVESLRAQTPLIRCKNCANWNANGDTHRCFVWCVYTPQYGFCHRAERKEE